MPNPLREDTELAFITALRYETEWSMPAYATDIDFRSRDNSTGSVAGYKLSETGAWDVEKGTIIALPTRSPDRTYLFYPNEGTDPIDVSADDWVLEPETTYRAIPTVPAIDMEQETDLSLHLEDIGLDHLDDTRSGCGLSGYSNDSSTLAVTVIMQKATFTLDDKGIAASAITVIETGVTSVPIQEQPVEIIVDRPYAMLTVDGETGWALMYVTISDPASVQPTK